MRNIDSIKVCLVPHDAGEHRLVQRLGERGIPLIPWSDEQMLGTLLAEYQSQGYDGKEVLVLKRFKGRFFQNCPGSRNVICCNYLLLNTTFGCLFDCAYCFLLSYLNSFGITHFLNLDEEIDNLPHQLPSPDGKIRRLGTGEFTDSLMFDEITGIASQVMKTLAHRDDIFLEFKTKSVNIAHLIGKEKHRRAVIAWSVNTDRGAASYEKDAAAVNERIEAAREAVAAGFMVAFHFDPIIMYPGFARDYINRVHDIFERVDHRRVAWISLGCFRYAPGFDDAMRARFPETDLSLGEMLPGIDGKYRYLKADRVAIYGQMLAAIRSRSPVPFVYLCMESDDVWREAFGMELRDSDHLEYLFGEHLRRYFP